MPEKKVYNLHFLRFSEVCFKYSDLILNDCCISKGCVPGLDVVPLRVVQTGL